MNQKTSRLFKFFSLSAVTLTVTAIAIFSLLVASCAPIAENERMVVPYGYAKISVAVAGHQSGRAVTQDDKDAARLEIFFNGKSNGESTHGVFPVDSTVAIRIVGYKQGTDEVIGVGTATHKMNRSNNVAHVTLGPVSGSYILRFDYGEAANLPGDKAGLPEGTEFYKGGEQGETPSGVTWTHGTLSGWKYNDESGSPQTASVGDPFTMPKKETTLVAQWTATPYTINYVTSLPGGSSAGSQATGGATSFTMADSNDQQLSTSSDNSGQYAFKGWATASGASAANISGTEAIRSAVARGALTISPNNDITLYAVWSAAPFTINYTVAPNEGTGSYSQDFSMADTNVTLYNGSGFSRKGYNLAGWNYSGGSSNAGNKGDSVSPSNLIQNKDQSGNTVTLTARWEEILYGIEVDPNGATSISMVDYFGSVSYTVGSFNPIIEIPQSLSATDYEYRGKVFDGLAYTPTGAKISTQQINVIDVLNEPTAQISSSNVITLYAVWKDAAAGVTINGGVEQFYGTFDDAWTDADTQTATVKLYADASTTSSVILNSGNVTLDLNGHTIRGNGSASVIIVGGGSLTLNDNGSGGKITGGGHDGNTDGGGGVYVETGATFTMNGGTITGNTTNGSGGGVLNRGTFTMNTGSTISANSLEGMGGGVYNEGTFTLNGGTIRDNSSNGDAGGGVCNLGTFTMESGTISGNTAGSEGGGVFIESSGTFNISGNVQITGNQKTGNAASNVYLPAGNNGDSKTITLTGTLNAASRIGVTLQIGNGAFTTGWAANKDSADAATVFTSDVAGKSISDNVIGDEVFVVI